jgi:hypothetical protein
LPSLLWRCLLQVPRLQVLRLQVLRLQVLRVHVLRVHVLQLLASVQLELVLVLPVQKEPEVFVEVQTCIGCIG